MDKSREIKFRAWDTKQSKFIEHVPIKEYMLDSDEWNHHDLDDCNGIYPNSTFSYYSFKNRIIFQQFTGFLDSAGNEIYEGDIVKLDSELGKIEFGEFSDNEFIHHYGFFIDWVNWPEWDDGFHEEMAKFIKIVGNIFENLELIINK